MIRFTPDTRQNLLRALFILAWVVGLLGFWSAPIARLLVLGVRTGDPVDDALLALHPSNQWYHPRFYMPLRDAFRALVETLPADKTLHVIAGREADEPSSRGDQRELLRRSVKVWAYPRPVIWCEVPDIEAISTTCDLNGSDPVILWDLGDLPDYTCTAGTQGLTLCR